MQLECKFHHVCLDSASSFEVVEPAGLFGYARACRAGCLPDLRRLPSPRRVVFRSTSSRPPARCSHVPLPHRPDSGSTPGSHPHLMMRGTTSRHSHPSTTPNQSRRRLRPSEPSLRDHAASNEPRKCWICYDDDDAEEPLPTPRSSSPNGHSDTSQLRARRKWVKPCRCSLVAHESVRNPLTDVDLLMSK